MGIIIGVAAISGAAIWSTLRDSRTSMTTALSTGALTTSASLPVQQSLPPPSPDARAPLNDVDPVTGNPITSSSPTLMYKGYVIGFCCAGSEGYKGAWNWMSEAQKDAFVRRYLK